MAAAVEYSAGINDHARRVNLSRYHTFYLDLHAAFCENHAVKSARDHHAIAFDLSFDFGAFSKNHRLLGDDVAFHVAINAERAGDRQRAFQRHALIDESCPLFTCAIFGRAGPLPSHIKSPNQRLFYSNWTQKQVNGAERVSCRMKRLH